MTRTRMALILSAAGAAGVLGLAGCSAQHTAAAAAGAVTSDVADEAQALQTVGFETGLTSTPSASPSTSASAGATGKKMGKKGRRREAVRSYLRGNTLHGEVTVQGKDGVKTIVVQRGSVTAVTSTSVTVKSTDGFTETWTLGSGLKIVQAKQAVQASALKAGETIGVAGTKTGTADTAGLIAINK